MESTQKTVGPANIGKKNQFSLWIGIGIATLILAGGAVFVRLNQQLTQRTTDVRSQAASSCQWCAGNGSSDPGDQCVASTGHAATAFSGCGNGFCCIFNPDTTTQPTPTGGGSYCNQTSTTASACRGQLVGSVGTSGGVCTCRLTTGDNCACVAASPPPGQVCTGSCSGTGSCGAGTTPTEDQSCSEPYLIRCCQNSSLRTCYRKSTNCSSTLLPSCDGISTFDTLAACQAAVQNPTFQCFNKNNACLVETRQTACDNTTYFANLSACYAAINTATCYDKTNSCQSIRLPSCNENPYYSSSTVCMARLCLENPSAPGCATPTNCSADSGRNLGCDCTGSNQCGSGFCHPYEHRCATTDIYPICQANSVDCINNPTAINDTPYAYTCRQPGGTVPQLCCRPNTTSDYSTGQRRCLENGVGSYPICGTGLICDSLATSIAGATRCRPYADAPVSTLCCPLNQVIINGACRAVGSQTCDSTAATAPVCRGKSTQFQPSGANCTCLATSGTVCACVTNAPVGGGQCTQPGNSCNTSSTPNGNCCSGSYCQGPTGQQYCQTPGVTNVCPGGGICGGAGGYLGFRCSSLTNGQCLENAQTFNTYAEARAYAAQNGCGQVDTVCNGGDNNRNQCGAFEIITSSCGGTPPQSPQPSPTPTPPSTPTPPAPVCLNIAMSPAQPTIGGSVTFTCGQVAGVNHYEFRVKLPNGTIQNLTAATTGGRVSSPLTISIAGTYQAQCRICTGADVASCQAFEAF